MLIIAQDGLSLIYLNNIISINLADNELVASDIADGETVIANVEEVDDARKIINAIAQAYAYDEKVIRIK